MIDGTQQFDASAALARRFLLGQLSAPEQAAFEDRLFADDHLEVLVRLAECELADDYAFERLNHAERQLFTQRFLVTADRQSKVSVSSALRERFAFTSPALSVKKTTVGDKLQRLLSLDQPVRGLAYGVVLLLLLAGTVWLVLREPHINRLVQRPSARPTPAATPEVTHHGSEQPSPPPHRETASPMPDHEPPVVASVVLVPGKTRDLAQITAPKGERDVVRLQLTLERDRPGTYRVELLNAAGQSVFEAPALKSADMRVDFEVPARLLRSGDYHVRLSSSREAVASYYFRVQ